MSRIRIYISGPITKGNRNANLFQSHEAFDKLLEAGFAPHNPMMSMQLPNAWSGRFPHEVWLECDRSWVSVSQAVLRLPGDSDGADEECEYAISIDIPVFYSIDDLFQHFGCQLP